MNTEEMNQACLEARRRWDSVVKPLYSLGRLEDLVAGTIAAGTANVNMMAAACGMDVFAADMGMEAYTPQEGRA